MTDTGEALYRSMVELVRNAMAHELVVPSGGLVAPVVFFVTSREAIAAMCAELDIETTAPVDHFRAGTVSVRATRGLSGKVAYMEPDPYKSDHNIFMRRREL